MTKLRKVLYADYENHLPQTGNHIIGTETTNGVIVYQAYNQPISKFAVENQYFRGDFKFSRMSWIKTNFLWMMYRSEWASKKDQDCILAIEISKEAFRTILDNAVISSFDASKYSSIKVWKKELSLSEVRLQWDPDHEPNGNKRNRRVIQLGLKGNMLLQYSKGWIISIEDITTFVHEQRENILLKNYVDLTVVKEDLINVNRNYDNIG